MGDEIKTEKIGTVNELFDFIKQNCGGDERIETVAWTYEQDYEDVTTHLDYGDEDLFLSIHDNKLRVIMGDSARVQYVKNMEALAEYQRQQQAKDNEQRQREIATARAILAKYNAGLTDDE